MAYKLKIIPNPSYLHVIVTGTNSAATVTAYFDEIRRECRSRNYFRILIEERLKGPRLKLFDIFKILHDESIESKGFFKTIAYVDVKGTDDLMKFMENVASNRLLPMFTFSTVDKARKWITDPDKGETGKKQ